MPNIHILKRLQKIQSVLMGVHQMSVSMSSAAKGAERDEFVSKFLTEVLPPTFRFGTGDATDSQGAKSGQLDIVVEYPFGPSLPNAGSASSRLYLAETVAAVIEVKSNAAVQWNEATHTANQFACRRLLWSGTSLAMSILSSDNSYWSGSRTLPRKARALSFRCRSQNIGFVQ